MNLKTLRARLAALTADGKKTLDLADKEGRALTDDERAQLDAAAKEMDTLEADIRRMERVLNLNNEVGERQEAESRQLAIDNRDDGFQSPRLFGSLAEQLQAIVTAGMPNMRVDDRLNDLNAAATGVGIGVPSDGGYLLQTEFSQDIIRRTYESAALASRCRNLPLTVASKFSVPYLDEKSRVAGSRWGGVQAYWADEGTGATPSQPRFGRWELEPKRLSAICYLSDESLEDAPMLAGIVNEVFPEELATVLDLAIFEGDGVGKPLGIKNHASQITVAKESGQAAATIVSENVIKMYSRAWGRSRLNAIWTINQDIEPALYGMGIVVGTGGTPIYMPPGGLSASPYSSLLGRPVVPLEMADTLGTKGDISLMNLSDYQLVTKGGTRMDTSMHVRFVQHEQAFRFSYRVNGQPRWKTALTPMKGTQTLSPFVGLAARA